MGPTYAKSCATQRSESQIRLVLLDSGTFGQVKKFNGFVRTTAFLTERVEASGWAFAGSRDTAAPVLRLPCLLAARRWPSAAYPRAPACDLQRAAAASSAILRAAVVTRSTAARVGHHGRLACAITSTEDCYIDRRRRCGPKLAPAPAPSVPLTQSVTPREPDFDRRGGDRRHRQRQGHR